MPCWPSPSRPPPAAKPRIDRERIQLNEKLYTEISVGKDGRRQERKDRKDSGRKDEELTRIFIARGRRDGITKRSLVNILCDQVGIRDQDLNHIEVMDDFSFVSTPEGVAKKILKYFSVPKGKGKPIATRAKDERFAGVRGGRDNFKKRKRWSEEFQPYGRDIRDGEDEGFRMPEKRRKEKGRKKRK